MSETDPAEVEKHHVHDVYERIASHFASTRYKPWPVVEEFLLRLPSGSCGLDVGCGNGKYLGVNRDLLMIASDRSPNLASIASTDGKNEVLIADGLDIPHPPGRLDFAIAIAVIHHFSSADRRRASIRAILDTLRPGAPLLLFVWALEQKGSRRGWDKGSKQDILVPWITKSSSDTDSEEAEKYLRYYHLYREGELEADVLAANGKVLDSGYDRDNWWVIAVSDLCNREPIER